MQLREDDDAPRRRLLLGQDFAVAAWTWKRFKLHPLLINRAFGLLENDELAGALIFHEWNGQNVNFMYYGRGLITHSMVRLMARVAIEVFKVQRVTFRIPRPSKKVGRQLRRYGAEFECTLKHFFGADLPPVHQYVMFRDQILKHAYPRYARKHMH